MRKLYTQYIDSETNTPFMVTFEGNQVQACANDGDTITIGSTEYVRVTDGSGHDVKSVIPNSGDETPHKLLVRLGDENTHDLCYIEDDGVVSSTSIQVTDIQPTPQETVITYTRVSASEPYVAVNPISGTIPENAYLTWEMTDRPTRPVNASGYKMYYHYSNLTYTAQLLTAQLLDGALPLTVSDINDSERTIGDLKTLSFDGETYFLFECVKRVKYKRDELDVEVENIEEGTTRHILDSNIIFANCVNEINQQEGDNAIRSLGNYLDFEFLTQDSQAEKTPEVKLHIPNA